MKRDERYFVKSFEEDFILKTLKNKKKVNFQSINDILKNKIIKPNTKSFGSKQRLACTILHKNYLKTYRAQGLIFQTNSKPEAIYPFDLALLTNTKNIIVQYYRIKKRLHAYYSNNLIKGFEKFRFKNFEKMTSEISSPSISWKKVNLFRKSRGFNELPKQKYKLVEYNEAIFSKLVKIKPVAIFGYSKLAKSISKKYGLLYFRNAKEFYNKIK